MTGLAMLIAVVMFDILSLPIESGLVSYTYAPAPYNNVEPAPVPHSPAGPTPVSVEQGAR
jgi:hypothetical protein